MCGWVLAFTQCGEGRSASRLSVEALCPQPTIAAGFSLPRLSSFSLRKGTNHRPGMQACYSCALKSFELLRSSRFRLKRPGWVTQCHPRPPSRLSASGWWCIFAQRVSIQTFHASILWSSLVYGAVTLHSQSSSARGMAFLFFRHGCVTTVELRPFGRVQQHSQRRLFLPGVDRAVLFVAGELPFLAALTKLLTVVRVFRHHHCGS